MNQKHSKSHITSSLEECLEGTIHPETGYMHLIYLARMEHNEPTEPPEQAETRPQNPLNEDLITDLKVVQHHAGSHCGGVPAAALDLLLGN